MPTELAGAKGRSDPELLFPAIELLPRRLSEFAGCAPPALMRLAAGQPMDNHPNGATPLTQPIHDHAEQTDQSFESLEMRGAEIASSEFHGCTFLNCSFVEATFKGCRFVDCEFRGCDLSLLQVPDTVFSAARFVDSKAIGINWALAGWPSANLGEPLAFFNCALGHSTFIGLKLRGIRIEGCVATDVDFREAELAESSFADTDLAESLFLHTDLSDADLSKARNYQISPADNELAGARFSLPEAMSLLHSLDIELVEGQ